MSWKCIRGGRHVGLHILRRSSKLCTFSNKQICYATRMSPLTSTSSNPIYLDMRGHYSTSSDPLNKTPEETVIHRLKRIEKSMKLRGYSILRIGAGILIVAGVGVYYFRDHLRHNVAQEVSSVASRSLEHEEVKLKAEELSKALLQAMLIDESIKSEAVRFLGEVIKSPQTKVMVIQLLTDLLNDPLTQRKLLGLFKQLVSRSLSDPTFRHNLAINLKDLFDDPITRAGLVSLVQHILDDDLVKEDAKRFVQEVLASSRVTQETTRLGKQALQGVVNDQSVQKRTGDAMWSAFTYSIRPSWFGSGSNKDTENKPQDAEPPPP